jgi:hypothetical protein
MLRLTGFFLLSCIAAASPWLYDGSSPRPAQGTAPFPAWPSTFEGRPLKSVPLTPLETRFAADFPGRIARFEQPGRHIVLRWVTAPTRALHPARDCFVASGYAITDEPLVTDQSGFAWSGFLAERDDVRLRVRERIEDRAGSSWTDVSAWYWDASLEKTTGPWLAIDVTEHAR